MRSFHVSNPCIISVDKKIPNDIPIRQEKYLNNIIEQDHRFIKKRVCSMLGFKSFKTAIFILIGIEAKHMMRNGHIDLQNQSVQN